MMLLFKFFCGLLLLPLLAVTVVVALQTVVDCYRSDAADGSNLLTAFFLGTIRN